jgi:hypothetical protein
MNSQKMKIRTLVFVVLFATGSAFASVEFEGRSLSVGTLKNAFAKFIHDNADNPSIPDNKVLEGDIRIDCGKKGISILQIGAVIFYLDSFVLESGEFLGGG